MSLNQSFDKIDWECAETSIYYYGKIITMVRQKLSLDKVRHKMIVKEWETKIHYLYPVNKIVCNQKQCWIWKKIFSHFSRLKQVCQKLTFTEFVIQNSVSVNEIVRWRMTTILLISHWKSQSSRNNAFEAPPSVAPSAYKLTTINLEAFQPIRILWSELMKIIWKPFHFDNKFVLDWSWNRIQLF